MSKSLDDPAASRRSFALRLTGLGVILGAALARTCVGFEPFPFWDGDPFIISSASTSIGPSASLLLDAASLLGAALAMLGAGIARQRPHPVAWLAALAGFLAVAFHSFREGSVVVDHLRLGSQWAAGFIGAAAAFEVCRDDRLRRLGASVLVAGVVMLAFKGVLQLLVEHPQTVAMFKVNRLEFFAAQGWTEDSSAARAFERRLLQPEASGWFGMSNVFASWGAFAGVALLGCTVLAAVHRARAAPIPRHVVLTLGAGAVATIGAVAMSQSKGGWVSLALGFTLLGIAAIATLRTKDPTRPPRWTGSLRFAPLACILAALAAITARGLLGERLHELSLYFRWFYITGASRIFAHHPLAGVGPDGFKDAYMTLKPPLSPEEVTSPHSILFDYTATLGIGGLLWAALWLWWTWCLGSAFLAPPPKPRHPPHTDDWTSRHELRLIFVIISIPTVLGSVIEAAAGTPEGTLVRLAGLIAATAVATATSALIRFDSRALTVMACGAAAFAAHAQIELTPVWPGSAPAFLLVFGVLAARAPAAPKRASPRTSAPARSPLVIAALLALSAACLLTFAWRPVHRWEQLLTAAAADADPASQARAAMQQLDHARPDERAKAAGLLSDQLSRLLGRPISDTESALKRGTEDLSLACGDRALAKLDQAASTLTHPGTLRAASRLALQLSTTHRERSEAIPAAALSERSEDFARRAADLPLSRASSLGWLGTVRDNIAEATNDRVERELAVDAWQGAAAADPYGLTWPLRLARVLHHLGRPDEASRWAKKALELDSLSRLDPLRGLSPKDKADMAAIASSS